MVWYVGPNDNQWGAAVFLDGDDGLFLAKTEFLWNPSGSGVVSLGVNNKIIIAGTLATSSSSTIGIAAQSLFGREPVNALLRVEAAGEVRFLGTDGSAVSVTGADTQIINQGLIASESTVAISLSMEGATTRSEIQNSGTIRAAKEAIERWTFADEPLSESTETVVLTNTGTIQAGAGYFSYLAATEADALDLITNSGRMVGSISLGLGADLYDGRGGSVEGEVFGGGGNDKLFGGAGVEKLRGDDGNDTLAGGAGIDDLQGGTGDDTLNGGAGADFMNGHFGNDTYYIDNAGDRAFDFYLDRSSIDGVTATVSVNLADGRRFSHIENITLEGSRAINAAGDGLANSITGNAASNVLNGAGGSDRLAGAGGNDGFLFNTALNATGNVDTLLDMNERGDDTIRLENAVFDKIIGTSTLTAAQFRFNNTGAAGDADDRIIHDRASGRLFYDADGNKAGGVAGVLFAIVDPNIILTNADFFVV